MHSTNRKRFRTTGQAGFTLVEILVVVVILGILAAIVVPQFTSASNESRENALKMDLHRIRQQLQIYHQQHNSTWPTLINFEDQMTLASNSEGVTQPVGTDGYRFGPYIRDVPKNPFMDENATLVGNGEPGTSGWYYDESTGAFHPNNSEEHRTY